MTVLTSIHNPQVKEVVKLHHAAGRRESGLLLIEGRHPIEEAIMAQLEILNLYIKEGESVPTDYSGPVITVSEPVMSRIATTDSPPPMLAISRPPGPADIRFLQNETVSLLGLVGLQDPGNVGTLIRCARAFGFDAVVFIDAQVDPYHPKVIRASAGQVFAQKIVSMPDWAAWQAQLTTLPSLTVWGTDAHQGIPYYEAQYGPRHLILMGSEAHGLSPALTETLQSLHIPIAAQVESLNVALAGAILMADKFSRQENNRV